MLQTVKRQFCSHQHNAAFRPIRGKKEEPLAALTARLLSHVAAASLKCRNLEKASETPTRGGMGGGGRCEDVPFITSSDEIFSLIWLEYLTQRHLSWKSCSRCRRFPQRRSHSSLARGQTADTLALAHAAQVEREGGTTSIGCFSRASIRLFSQNGSTLP